MNRVVSNEHFRGIRVDPEDPYMDQLAKLIPGESVAAFLAVQNYLSTSTELIWLAVLAGLILCVFFRGLVSVDNGQWNWSLLLLSIVAYFIWAGNIIAGPFTGQTWQAGAYVLLVIFTPIAPILYKKLGGTGKK